MRSGYENSTQCESTTHLLRYCETGIKDVQIVQTKFHRLRHYFVGQYWAIFIKNIIIICCLFIYFSRPKKKSTQYLKISVISNNTENLLFCVLWRKVCPAEKKMDFLRNKKKIVFKYKSHPFANLLRWTLHLIILF